MAPKTFFVRGFDELTGYLRMTQARRIMVVTSPRRRFVEPLLAALAALDVRVFDGAQVHVPIEVLDAADAELRDADAVVALGGGAAIGLGKALRVRHPHLGFVALPTTYSGSEMTSMYGTTTGTTKQTGKLEAARPDAVFYDPELTRELPLALSIQSLTNGIAHVASILSTSSLDPTARGDAQVAAATVVQAIERLIADPTSGESRELAQRGASACGASFELGKPGAQHGLAHLLGGALRVEHAALHSILLPHFIAHLRSTQPAVIEELERVLAPPIRSIYSGALLEREHDLDCYLHDVLSRAGAPVALTALGPAAPPAQIEAALATKPELPANIARDALYGLRPPGRLGRLDLGSEPHAVIVGCEPANAKAILLALHGRGAEAGTIARRYRD
ncbi:MAG: iron-containing alcohol dehydrogenase, partial [Deltaproteobacteria bacterium]|nr:iron-containing alcohol dehydrogenase [Deltaproteobacteria bacterium]